MANHARISVFGLGYVGCVTAACFAKLGYRVVGVDLDRYKVDSVNRGESPFYEPGLAEIVKETAAAGTLRATDSASQAVAESDVAFVCVGTPSERNGNLGLDQLRRVVEQFGASLRESPKPFTIAIRSTVFPGTCEQVVQPRLEGIAGVEVVSNPEFLREGSAVRDFEEPSLIVVGGESEAAVEAVAALYEPLGSPVSRVSLRTAEMIKYACNAFHAVKIGFANEIGALAERLGVDGKEVMRTLCQDEKLNVSRAYLSPGPAFGGSCLPKDLRALNYRASRLDLELPLLGAVLPSNDSHLQRAIDHVLGLPPGRVGVIGLAFKENTDDLRESPAVTLLERLIGKGREVRVYDPHIRMEGIYGANKSYALEAIPHIERLLVGSLQELFDECDHLVLMQPPAKDLAEKVRASGRELVNLAGALAGELYGWAPKPAAAIPTE